MVTTPLGSICNIEWTVAHNFINVNLNISNVFAFHFHFLCDFIDHMKKIHYHFFGLINLRQVCEIDILLHIFYICMPTFVVNNAHDDKEITLMIKQ